MDDDIDFDDPLGEERAGQITIQRPVFDASAAPSENELRLGRRVIELEKEREIMVAELHALHSKQLSATAASSTVSPSAPTATDSTSEAVIIPHALLPTLAVLRQHISDLTRDNAALRYTFLGPPASGKAVRPSTPGVPNAAGMVGSSPLIPSLDQASIFDPPAVAGGKGGVEGVDVEKVLVRVRALMLENEELGAMVLAAGRVDGGAEEWQQALNESKAVIESLDADLSHHLATIQTLRTELQTYKSQTPLAAPSGPSRPASSHSKTASMSMGGGGGSHSSRAGSAHGGGTSRPSAHRDRERDRDRDAKPHEGRERPRERIRDQATSEQQDGSSQRRGSGVPAGPAGLATRLGPPGAAGLGSRGGSGKHQHSNSDAGVRDKDPPRGPREDRDVKRRR